MGVESTIGTAFYVSAEFPATNDVPGYEGLTWTKLGEVTDYGDIGSTTEMLEHVPVETGVKEKIYGVTDEGSYPLKAAKDSGDAGQDIIETAYNSSPRAYISTKLVERDGTTEYAKCAVSGLPVTFGSASAIKQISVDLTITGQRVK